ncbi:hypothetical protein O3P69_010821 [Scylla paramamosain]|uniref:Uncharacterized protein n=1 Tax=Scylla paramamosain TaxID=85552 RepID=A0AAW0TFA6_SCYPA
MLTNHVSQNLNADARVLDFGTGRDASSTVCSVLLVKVESDQGSEWSSVMLVSKIPVFLKYHAPPTDQALRGDYTRRAASTKDGIQKLWMTLRLYKHPCSRDDGCCHY